MVYSTEHASSAASDTPLTEPFLWGVQEAEAAADLFQEIDEADYAPRHTSRLDFPDDDELVDLMGGDADVVRYALFSAMLSPFSSPPSSPQFP